MIMKAIKLANMYHKFQVDKIGMSYILHPIHVYCLLPKPCTQEEAVTAILHDVVEDTDCTLDVLRSYEFPENIVEAVDAITRKKDETYMEYLERCCKNPIAKKVKKADVEHNYSRSINLPDSIPEETRKELNSLKTRYEKSLKYLQGE